MAVDLVMCCFMALKKRTYMAANNLILYLILSKFFSNNSVIKEHVCLMLINIDNWLKPPPSEMRNKLDRNELYKKPSKELVSL